MDTPTTVAEPQLVLASASPRRRELLARTGCAFVVQAATVDEGVRTGESPADYVLRVAQEKALWIHSRMPHRHVLGADTAVVLGERILGKPASDDEARAMLTALADRSHEVFSAVVLACPDGRRLQRLSVTEVVFAALPPTWIEHYVRSGAGRDKAGAYGIQNEAGLWVRRIRGSYSGVVGLPLFETTTLLREAGLLHPG